MEDLLNATLNATLNVTHAPHAPGGHKDPTPPSRTVLIIMITILVAAFLHHHQRYLFFPFTVLMFLFGMGIGGLTHAAPSMKDYIMIQHIDAHLILHVFLPVLIYDGSAALKLSVLSKVMKQALILAGPGLVLHTVLVGIFMRYVLYDFTWPAALLFGSILSATDPVAVVAILKELDADTAVTVLTDGEAIFNDGTAIIFFAIFYAPAQVSGSFAPWHEYIWRIPLYTVGAYAFGKICGIIVLFCMTRVHNEPVVETLVQLGGAYLVFWVADTPMQSSGVLAVCFMALHIASNRSLMTNELSEMNENFWELTVFIANALIFALVGLIIATDAIPKASGRDYGMLIALYLLIHVFRAIMIGTFAPFFGSGYAQLTKQRFGMLVYGALRGGVALTLALVVARDDSFSEEVRNKTLFLTGGIVILFIAINGSTSKYIVEFLGLDLKPPYRNYQFRHGQKLVEAATEEFIRSQRSEAVGYVNWPLLRKLTIKGFSEHLQDDARVASKCSAREFIDPALIRAMKHALQRHREEGMISNSSFELLAGLFDTKIDAGELVGVDDLRHLLQKLEASKTNRWKQVERMWDQIFSKYTSQDVMKVECVATFLLLLEEVRPTIMMLVSRRFSVKPQMAWIEKEEKEASALMHDLAKEHPGIVSGVQTRRYSQAVLNASMEAIDSIETERGFPRSQANGLRDEMSVLQHHVAQLDLGAMTEAAPESVFENCIIFEGIDEALVHRVLRCAELKEAHKGSEISMSAGNFCVAVKGRLVKRVRNDKFDLVYGPSDFFGLQSALGEFKADSYVCLDDVVYYDVQAEPLQQILNTLNDSTISAFKKHLWSMCGARVAMNVLHRNYPYCNMSGSDLLRICSSGKLKQCPLDASSVLTPGTAAMTPVMTASAPDVQAQPDQQPKPSGSAKATPTDLQLGVTPFPTVGDPFTSDAFTEQHMMRHETFTDPSSAWFLISGTDITGAITSSSIRTLPIKQIIRWAPGAIIFHLRDFPLSRREVKMTGIPIVDSLNIKLEHVLSSLERAEEDGKTIINLVTSQLMLYCTMFPVLEVLFERHDELGADREWLERASQDFTLNIRQWLIGQFVVPMKQSRIVRRLKEWVEDFVQVEHLWAHTITSHRGYSPYKHQNLGDIVSKARLHAWYVKHGLVYDCAESMAGDHEDDSSQHLLNRSVSFSEPI